MGDNEAGDNGVDGVGMGLCRDVELGSKRVDDDGVAGNGST